MLTGGTRTVSCKDRVHMPYTDAVLFETLRKGNIVPTALPHAADQQLEVDGMVNAFFILDSITVGAS